MTMVPAVTTAAGAAAMASSPYTPHWALYPRSYVAHRVSQPLIVDGNIDKAIWNNDHNGVVWSDAFVEIDNGDTLAAGTTKFKALYDDNYLYIAALLSPAPHLPTTATFIDRNDPIYQRDSDFEVFVDVENSHHHYKEVEINALGTVWNLLLDKPYVDGGMEHSGRVAKPGEPLNYDVRNQHVGTRILTGRLNDAETGAQWSVELALAWSDLLANTTITSPPTILRINFSRVERRGATNWVWQPQVRWDAQQPRFRGFVDMHMPDAWGYLILEQLSASEPPPEPKDTTTVPAENASTTNVQPSSSSSPPLIRDELWPAKLVATTLYYALHAYFDIHGAYTTYIEALTLPSDIIEPSRENITIITVDDDDNNKKDFLVTVTMDHVGTVSIRSDRLLRCTYNLVVSPLPPTSSWSSSSS
jgi:hypothetical protein